MKKDYSNNKLGRFGLDFCNNIGLIISILLSIIIYLIFKIKGSFVYIIIGCIHSFIGLSIAGKLLDKNCTNFDIEKCKKCKCWNCSRDIKE